MKINLEWLKAAGTRAAKTVAQTALGMFTVGAALSDINWLHILSVALVAGIYSMLTSMAGLPEVGSDGTLYVDKTDPTKNVYRFEFTKELEALGSKPSVKLNVNDKPPDTSRK